MLATPSWSSIPYDYDFHEDPYPYYRRLRDEAPLYHNEKLGFWALSRHRDVHQGFRNSTTLSNRDGVALDPISRGPHASKTMSFLAMDDPGASAAAHAGLKGLHAAPDSRTRAAGDRTRRAAPRRHAGEGRPPELPDRRLRRGIRRQAADGRDLRADGRAGGRPRPHPRHGRRRDAPRRRRHTMCRRRRSRRRST